jgi:hypothetical protein
LPAQWNAAKSRALAAITTVEPTMNSGFLDVLHAHGPAVDQEKKMALYGQFIGSWDTDIVTHEPNGVEHRGNGEIHFGWVLEGRAIQDVWMIPRRAERRPDMPALPVAGNWYGTTLRVYDPGIDAWHILWTDPANQIYTQQIGRARGVDIVQEGKLPTGAILRWSFTQITAHSFRWLGEHSADDGVSWWLQVEVIARRTGSPEARSSR